jgi:hypothetical protein
MDADSGYAGLMTKNPAHGLWRVTRGPRMAYELVELAEWVDLSKHIPKRKPAEVGLGRNVTIFEWLRCYAYSQIRHYKGDVRNFVLWQSHLNNRALERNGDLLVPLAGNEVWHIAKSVSKWTWNKFDLAASDARFSQLQAHRGKQGMLKRWGDSEDKQVSAKLMAAAGRSVREIAAELEVGKSTVARWLAVP